MTLDSSDVIAMKKTSDQMRMDAHSIISFINNIGTDDPELRKEAITAAMWALRQAEELASLFRELLVLGLEEARDAL